MGRAPRPRPARLAKKLEQIRTALALSQAQMFERLGDTGTRLYARHIDDYEKDRRIPHLEVVLAYARVAGIPMELIVDDKLDLPKRLPSMPDYEWIMRRSRKAAS
jgi:transcriptional regulator with XRE-family HTH domain